jgi:hypothetical protein
MTAKRPDDSALTDHVKVARVCNTYTLSDFPAATYSSQYDKDQNLPAGNKIFQQTVK